MKLDIHIHTELSSCSSLRIEDIMEYPASPDLDGLCITDHGTMAIRNHLKEGVQKNGLTVFFGMEYETRDGDFLIFGPYEEIPGEMDAVSLLDFVKKTGGAAIAAHPFRSERPVAEYIIEKDLCHIIEGVNGRNRDIENLRVEGWRKKYSFFETGGSDAHSLAELGEVTTNFTVPVRSRSDFVYALKQGLYSPPAVRLNRSPVSSSAICQACFQP